MINPTSSNRLQNIHDDEEVRIARVLAWLSGVAILLLLAIGGKAWLSGNTGYGQILFVFAALMLANLLDFCLTRNRRRQKISLLTIVAFLFSVLMATGGENNTGPLWFYVFPPLVFFLTGLTAGLALSAGCIAVAALVFWWPGLPFANAEYSADFQLRFLVTLLFESAFCFVMDYGRRKARSQLVAMAILYERAARTDELTGLPNRRDMQQHLAQSVSRFERHGHPCSVVLLDLDHFKKINDDFGHDAGDLVLIRFAKLLREHCRQADVAARWGGEEFLVLLPDTGLLQALVLAERLRAATEAHEFIFESQRLHITLSAGVCSIPPLESAEKLLREADLNLYAAKTAGRNRIVPRQLEEAPDAALRQSPPT